MLMELMQDDEPYVIQDDEPYVSFEQATERQNMAYDHELQPFDPFEVEDFSSGGYVAATGADLNLRPARAVTQPGAPNADGRDAHTLTNEPYQSRCGAQLIQVDYCFMTSRGLLEGLNSEMNTRVLVAYD
eukprot:1412923-Alexandrium_andersonii.AAC.1